jgi:exodeoxyribonuclease VII small subunit
METAMTDEHATFEAAYAELEQVVARLQDGGLTLEESMDLFERGMLLARRCSEQLEQAELKVRELLDDGQLQDLEPEL